MEQMDVVVGVRRREPCQSGAPVGSEREPRPGRRLLRPRGKCLQGQMAGNDEVVVAGDAALGAREADVEHVARVRRVPDDVAQAPPTLDAACGGILEDGVEGLAVAVDITEHCDCGHAVVPRRVVETKRFVGTIRVRAPARGR